MWIAVRDRYSAGLLSVAGGLMLWEFVSRILIANQLFLAATSQIVYAADQARGVLKSLDGGARWHTSNVGLSLTSISSLAVDPQSPRTVYASAGPLGLFKSSDGGAHWRPLASGPHSVDGVALDPSNPRNIIAVATGYGLARSTDGGRTWAEATFGRGVLRVGFWIPS